MAEEIPYFDLYDISEKVFDLDADGVEYISMLDDQHIIIKKGDYRLITLVLDDGSFPTNSIAGTVVGTGDGCFIFKSREITGKFEYYFASTDTMIPTPVNVKEPLMLMGHYAVCDDYAYNCLTHEQSPYKLHSFSYVGEEVPASLEINGEIAALGQKRLLIEKDLKKYLMITMSDEDPYCCYVIFDQCSAISCAANRMAFMFPEGIEIREMRATPSAPPVRTASDEKTTDD